MKIKQIDAREILDSRGNPTVECHLQTEDNLWHKASVPSGASVGLYEAVEIRDNDSTRYAGKGVLSVVKTIKNIIGPALIGQQSDISSCDTRMLELDGTDNKSRLGANAILPVSIAVTRAQAASEKMEVYELIQAMMKRSDFLLPCAMFNIFNGGVHASNNVTFQEFMVMPVQSKTFDQALECSVLVYKKLALLLKEQGCSTGVGDEGGFAPLIQADRQSPEREVLDFLLQAVEAAGYRAGRDVLFCLDIAASQFFSKEHDCYVIGKKKMTTDDLIDEYRLLGNEYPIYSFEDPLYEDDWDGWKDFTETLGKKVQIVGDDIFVSNPKRIMRGIEQHIANAVLIKPNQIGCVSQTLQAIKISQEHGYNVVVSHRSGETNDTFIADLVVGSGAGQCKAGAPVRGERIAKYNRLLEIERKLLQKGKHSVKKID